MTELTIIIVKFKHEARLKICLDSIPKKKSWQVIVIDNSIQNRGFGAACNLGAKQAEGQYLLFLNPDTVVSESAIKELIKQLKNNPQIGIIGPQLRDRNKLAYLSFTQQPTLKSAFFVYSIINTWWPNNKFSRAYWYRGQSLDQERRVESISGAAMMMRRVDFEAVGGFDEQYFLYWEDADLCRRISSYGKTIVYNPKAKIQHDKGGSTKPEAYEVKRWFKKSRTQYFRKHFGLPYALSLELWLTALEEWRLLLIIALATWLRFDRITTMSPLIFDQARDYLAAWEGLRQKELPWLGIPSSLPRFKQGPVYIWILMGVFFLFGVKGEAAAVMAASLGLLAVLGTYLLADRYWGRTPATIAALLLATSPLAVAHARMAFIINAIPLMSVIYLWQLSKPYRNRWNLFGVGLSFALLFQFELALWPLLLLGIAYIWQQRRAIKPWGKGMLAWLAGLGLGLLPQVIYDLTHRFQQLALFIGWTGYRLLRGVGLGSGSIGNFGSPSHALQLMGEYLIKLTSWDRPILSFIFILINGYGLAWYLKKKPQDNLVTMAFFWIFCLLIAFIIHGNPSEAYFPGFFIPVVLLTGWAVGQMPKNGRQVASGVMVIIALSNAWLLIDGQKTKATYGIPLTYQKQIAHYIRQESKGRDLTIRALGPGSEFSSFLDNYRFLLLGMGVKLVESDGWPVWIVPNSSYQIAVPDWVKTTELYGLTIVTPYE